MSRCKKVIFIHVGKAGGSSFNRVLEQNLSGEVHCERYIETSAGPDRIARRRLGKANHLNTLGFISGHIGFDVLLQSDLDLRNYLLVTMLRHPVAQTLSHMNWVIRLSAHQDSALFRDATPNVQKMSLDLRAVPEWTSAVAVQWLERYRGWFQNNQSRYFVSPDRLTGDEVIEVVSQMDLVGVTERVDRFVARFAQLASLPFRLRAPSVPHENQNHAYRIPVSVLDDPQFRDFLREYNRVDMEVYEYVDRVIAP